MLFYLSQIFDAIQKLQDIVLTRESKKCQTPSKAISASRYLEFRPRQLRNLNPQRLPRLEVANAHLCAPPTLAVQQLAEPDSPMLLALCYANHRRFQRNLWIQAWARRLAQKGWAAPHENILPLRNEQRRTPGVQNGSQVFTMNEAPCAQAHERKT